jgi:hypothetical protein
MLIRRAIRLALATWGFAAAAAKGQDARSVRVRVTDTTGIPVTAATVSVLTADNRLLAAGPTDTSGTRVLRVQAKDERLQLSVQRVGFLATRRVLRLSDRATTIDVALSPVSAALDTIRVSDRSRQLGAQPVIRGDEIVNTPRGVFDFIDVLKKLRPELLDHISDDIKYKCQPTRSTGPFRIYVNERAIPYFPETFDDILHDLKSDAIDELRYVSCFDKSLGNDDYPNVGRVYVTLRKGYAFNIKRGTYRQVAKAEQPTTPRDTTPLRPDHARLIGVFDANDGTPIEGAEVIDVLTGYSALTTRTGTVALAFVDSNGTLLKIQRTGYVPFTSPVTNRAADPPLTITLVPRGPVEPRLTRVPNPADTVRKLRVSGFYERRDTMPVPVDALLGPERIASLARVADAAAVMKRRLCTDNLFIDGARVVVDRDVDALVTLGMIVGIETYLDAEVAPPFTPTPGATPRCATLLWTR